VPSRSSRGARAQKCDEERRLQNAALGEPSVRSAKDVSYGMNGNDPNDQGAVNWQKAEFRIVVSKHAAGTMVVPEGELDLATAPDLEAVLTAHSGPVVVDLRKLSFIDVSGLRVLLEADVLSRQDGMNLRFIPGPMVRRLFEVAELPDPLLYVEPRPT
jgi:anti-sigma B factor antagonist